MNQSDRLYIIFATLNPFALPYIMPLQAVNEALHLKFMSTVQAEIQLPVAILYMITND